MNLIITKYNLVIKLFNVLTSCSIGSSCSLSLRANISSNCLSDNFFDIFISQLSQSKMRKKQLYASGNSATLNTVLDDHTKVWQIYLKVSPPPIGYAVPLLQSACRRPRATASRKQRLQVYSSRAV